MKKIYLKTLLAALLLLCSTAATAHDFEVDGIYYNITDATAKTVAVTYKGSSSYTYSNEYSGSVNIPATVTHDGTTYSVTSIRNYAFYECTSLASITIPNSVTSIGNYAFYECTSLASITIGKGVASIGKNAFAPCINLTAVHISDLAAWCNISFSDTNSNPLFYAKNLYLNGEKVTNLVIPEGVTSIRNYAFYECKSLASITIPSSVTSIGEYAFRGCTSLASITIPAGVTSIGEYAFYECTSLASITIPNSVTSIGNYAFYDCDGLTSITIPNSVTSIGEYAFYGCTGLASITIPSSVTSIGINAFECCIRLKVVYNNSALKITKGATSHGDVAYYASAVITPGDDTYKIIGDYIFSSADSVNTLVAYTGTDSIISLPASYNGENYVIGEKAFSYCKSLASITIPAGVTSIGKSTFYSCKSLTSITIPSSVTSIGNYAFEDCSSLASITIPNSVTSIGDRAFAYCKSLASITIPNSVTSIGKSTFYNCTGLASIIIPNSVTSIGDYAFERCTGLASITIPANVANIGNYAFYDCDNIKNIYVKSKTPATIGGNYAFYDQYYDTIYVPKGTKDVYKAADYWKNFRYMMEADYSITGDVDGDGSVDVADVTTIVAMILDKDLYDLSGDVDGDGTVDVADITSVVSVILGTNKAPARAAEQGVYNVELNAEGDDNALEIEAATCDYPYSAVQFDVYLPEGVTATGYVSAAGNAACGEQADGAVRVVVFSADNSCIAGESIRLNINTATLGEGSYPVEIKNVTLSAAGRSKVLARDAAGYITIAGTTGIDGVVSDAGNADAVVYDLQGHRVTEIVKGRVYIKNGSKFIAQ